MTLADLRQLLRDLHDWRPGKLAKGSLALTLGIGLRTACQAIVFIVVARLLGIEAYGAYAAVLAIAGTIGCFGGLGIQAVMLRDVSRKPASFPHAWGQTLMVMAVGAPVLLGLYLLSAWLLLPAELSWRVIICIGVAELFPSPISQAAVNAYQGHEYLGKASWFVFTPVAFRLAGALALLVVLRIAPNLPPLDLWAAIYLATAIPAAIYAVSRVNRDLGQPRWPTLTNIFNDLRAGMLFALSGTALKLYADIDKTMLARLAGLEAAGLYSAAYRIMDMATIPVTALLTALLPRFFRASRQQGQEIPSGIPWQLLTAPTCYTTGIGLFIYFAASWLPFILGSNFLPAVVAVQWLAWLPLVSLPRLLLQTKLIAGDLQQAVVSVLGAGAALNIFLNIILIPSMNWRGAILATYATEVAMGLILLHLAHKKAGMSPLL